jgi:hypothetical protein
MSPGRGPLRIMSLLAGFLLVLMVMGQVQNPTGWQWAGSGATAVDGPAPLLSPDPQASLTASAEALARQIRQLPWDAIQDDTVFRAEENDVWFGLWRLLHSATTDDLRQLSVAAAGPLQLMRQTELYRGRVVTIEGRVRRAHYLPAPDNDQRVPGYWQLWLQTASPSGIPVVAYALKVPPGFSEGMDIDQPAIVQGVVLKRWAYVSGQGSATAPVVMARQVSAPGLPGAPSRPSRTRLPEISLPAVIGISAAVALVAVALVAWQWKRRPVRSPVAPPENWDLLQQHLEHASHPPPSTGESPGAGHG